MKKRLFILDNAKIILIFFVILGHVIENTVTRNTIYKFIYMFHMPMFVIITGFTFKNYIINFNHKKILKKTIIPYYIFQVFYYLVLTKSFNFYKVLVIPYYHLWFLLSLYFWCILTKFIKTKEKSKMFILSIFISIFIGYTPFGLKYFSFGRTFLFYPFFLVGFYNTKELIFKLKENRLIIILISVICTAIFLYFQSYIPNKLLWGHYPYKKNYYSIFRLFILLYSFILSGFFFSIIPDKKYYFSKYGAQTFNLYIFHALIIKLLKRFIDLSNFKLILNLPIQIIITVCIIIFIVTFDNYKMKLSIFKRPI